MVWKNFLLGHQLNLCLEKFYSMNYINKYKVLTKQKFSNDGFHLVPLRYEDRYKIMKWRNDQIFHLRQSNKLTKKNQDKYFSEIISKTFESNEPNQILFSLIKNENCIAYGGLVHINWIDKNAEISFVIDTDLEKNYFKYYWGVFLNLINEIAFKNLNLNKIFTYAYDLRPLVYEALENNGFIREAELTNHCFINGEFHNVIIHSKFNIQ